MRRRLKLTPAQNWRASQLEREMDTILKKVQNEGITDEECSAINAKFDALMRSLEMIGAPENTTND